MQIKSIEDLFVHLLSDTYSAEKQLLRALPKLSRAAENPKLSEAFASHLEETRIQVERIDQVVESIPDLRLKRIKCVAMEGLVEEGQEIIDGVDKGAVRDAGLIAAAQKVEHYEIAAYGTLCTLAKMLGYQEAKTLLGQTLEEEKSADSKLSTLAESGINQDAKQKG
ncbi:ferritin-like domain-containing protein [Buttiauxella gaviniae]|uniref:Ferritin-like domain-containing protein n=1 Tax=Buttiauxella gaviniae TaxID=82990 RepID=A0ABV3NZ20_9ENTR